MTIEHMYVTINLLPSLYWQQEGGVSGDRNYFLFYPLCRCRCSCRLHMQMAWWWGLNGNKPDGLVLPSKTNRQENPRVAARGFSFSLKWNYFLFAYLKYSIGYFKIQLPFSILCNDSVSSGFWNFLVVSNNPLRPMLNFIFQRLDSSLLIGNMLCHLIAKRMTTILLSATRSIAQSRWQRWLHMN